MAKGDWIGTVRYSLNGETLAETKITAAEDVAEVTFTAALGYLFQALYTVRGLGWKDCNFFGKSAAVTCKFPSTYCRIEAQSTYHPFSAEQKLALPMGFPGERGVMSGTRNKEVICNAAEIGNRLSEWLCFPARV